eukprot:15361548-Ditylum_brightwellii.AAC.1
MDTMGLLHGPLVLLLSPQTTRLPYDNSARLQKAYVAITHPQAKGCRSCMMCQVPQLESGWQTYT